MERSSVGPLFFRVEDSTGRPLSPLGSPFFAVHQTTRDSSSFPSLPLKQLAQPPPFPSPFFPPGMTPFFLFPPFPQVNNVTLGREG